MFKFLKEKIGGWLKKTKETLQKKEEEKELEEKQLEISKKEKPSKKQKKSKGKEIKQEQKIEELEKKAAKLKKDIAEEKVEGQIEKIQETVNGLKEEIEKEKEEISENKTGFFGKLKSVFSYKISEEDFEEIFADLETHLLENNIAFEVVEKIKKDLKNTLLNKEIKKQDLENEIKTALKKSLEEIIIEPDDILETIKQIKKEKKTPFKILFFGINGAGKTTTIAKFTHMCQKNNLSCILAAGDTFRAASIEQLQEHGNKLNAKVIKHDYGADPSAVAFDAIKYASSHNIDVVLIDTAGRMHTKDNLLNEIQKISKVSKPDLKIFVAESISGNDATEQARIFHEKVNIDGSILTKSDVDEKGGTIISISYITKKPIFYLGTGQKYEDLKLFNKQEFIKSLGFD